MPPNGQMLGHGWQLLLRVSWRSPRRWLHLHSGPDSTRKAACLLYSSSNPKKDICASCASGATCDGDSCTCADGFRGSGVECPTVDGLMVPIDSALVPSFDEATRQCTDPYWLTIAQIPGSSVIIDNPSGKWKPCMNDILSKGVDVYIRLSTTQENAVSKLNFITANFKNRFSGVYLEPCSEHVLTLVSAILLTAQ